jgi:hypothetical protein
VAEAAKMLDTVGATPAAKLDVLVIGDVKVVEVEIRLFELVAVIDVELRCAVDDDDVTFTDESESGGIIVNSELQSTLPV